MNREFLFLAVIVLAARFAALFGEPTSRRVWFGITAAQLMALGLFVPTVWTGLAAATLLGGNLLEGWWARRPSHREGVHLLSIAVQLAVLSVCFSPASGTVFQSWALRLGAGISEWTAFGGVLNRVAGEPQLKLWLGLLLAVGEGDRIVRWALERAGARPQGILGQVDVDEFGRGRVIGMLERTLIYLFTLAGALGAVGFVVAAKALVQARRMQERDITSYVLIGTLGSSAVALVIGLVARFALGR